MTKKDSKCFICMKPADPSNKINVRIESATGDEQEEHLLCNLHLAEHKMLKRKNNASRQF